MELIERLLKTPQICERCREGDLEVVSLEIKWNGDVKAEWVRRSICPRCGWGTCDSDWFYVGLPGEV